MEMPVRAECRFVFFVDYTGMPVRAFKMRLLFISLKVGDQFNALSSVSAWLKK
jgi:hypothetical protein